MSTNILIVIPARGGSKGIPRKNLRLLNQRPLIAYAIKAAQHSEYNPDVYVSSDDEEILTLAAKLGSLIHRREDSLASDACTLDPVIYDVYDKVTHQSGCTYTLIVTLQPTSPLLKTASLDRAIAKMLAEPETDTLISAREDTHLTWRMEGNRILPNYEKRVNRQYLPPIFRETGAFLITRPEIISPISRIGRNVGLFLLSGGEEIDIDVYEDWNLCEFILKRKTVLFVVSGNDEIGLGHVYRCLLLAGGILNHRVIFLVDYKSRLAFEKISQHHYEVHIQQNEELFDAIDAFSPDVVINDILDTPEDYVRSLKKRQFTVINFEDLGEGAQQADLVINALYPERSVLPNHYFGHAYFCARDEFIYSAAKKVAPPVTNILLTYGGVDPNNLTRKTLASIYNYCCQQGITIRVVLGLGYRQQKSLAEFEEAIIRQDVHDISQEMLQADIAFTSAGRTVYELACIGTPTIVMAQNNREMTHLFASGENGFITLGLGADRTASEILAAFRDLVENFNKRQRMNEIMLARAVRTGRGRVLKLIQDTIERQERELTATGGDISSFPMG